MRNVSIKAVVLAVAALTVVAAVNAQDPWHEKDPELSTPRMNGCIKTPAKPVRQVPVAQDSFCVSQMSRCYFAPVNPDGFWHNTKDFHVSVKKLSMCNE